MGENVPLLPLESLLEIAACPACRSPLTADADDLTCSACGRRFVHVDGSCRLPVLIDADTSVVDVEHVVRAGAPSVIDRSRGGRLLAPVRRLTKPRNTTAERCLRRLTDEVRGEGGGRPRVLIIGGGSVGEGAGALYEDDRIDLVAFDIYASRHVQFIADAHRIPLADASVHGVVVQAVLEHVLEPGVVVAEIHRVLGPEGLVYADTPFMQQVHEGAYDFTRFTESGHRHLFRWFAEVERGVVAGLGTQLRWSLDYFTRGLLRSQMAGRLVRLAFFWLSWLDGLLGGPATVDGASSVFFYGRRADTSITPMDAIRGYRGAQ